MSISTEEAAQALASVKEAMGRARLAQSYEVASVMTLLWGGIWMVCYGAGWLVSRELAGALWTGLVPIGGVLTGLWCVRVKRRHGEGQTAARIGEMALALWLFGFLLLHLVRPLSYVQISAYWTLVSMLGYVLLGIAYVRFYLWLGIGVTLLMLAIYSWAGPWFDAGMTLGCGGTLVLAGGWLKWKTR